MKKTINYEKDILFKTNIGEMCSISLEHDFTVDDGYLRGEFLLEGEYKPNGLSLNKEPFSYRLPLEYELERTVDLDTLSYDIENFEYNVHEDELSVYIDFGVRYEEKIIEPTIPVITEEEINSIDFSNIDLPMFRESDELLENRKVDDQVILEVDSFNKEDDKEDIRELTSEVAIFEEEQRTSEINDEIKKETVAMENRLDENDSEMIFNNVFEGDEFVTYHVHIIRETDTLESIALKYNCSVDLIKEYNDVENFEIKNKLIIPQEKYE